MLRSVIIVITLEIGVLLYDFNQNNQVYMCKPHQSISTEIVIFSVSLKADLVMHIPVDLIKTIRVSKRVTALTGAGVSAESGLQTFREADLSAATGQALWSMYRPEELATPEAFERNPELVWEFYAMRRLKAGEVKPNPGHVALAEMGRFIPDFTLITQNVDGLHQQAGSQGVIELHGNITRIKCSYGCGVFTEWEDLPGRVPICPYCGAKLRPDVVWFGEMLPADALDAAIKAAQNCQVFFSIGTSGLVQPAASLAIRAKQHGACLVEINKEETPLKPYDDYFLVGKSGEILPKLVQLAWKNG
jgi:NAD-dependent deacetylase